MSFLLTNTFSYYSHSTLHSSKFELPISKFYLNPYNNISINPSVAPGRSVDVRPVPYFGMMCFLNSINPNLTSISIPRTQLFTLCCTTNTSLTSTPTNLSSTQKKFSQIVSKNAVKLLIGSIILVGSLSISSKQAKATIPVQKGANLEEKSDENEELYVKLLEQEPRNVEALKVLVNVKMRNGKTKEGVKYVEKLIEIEPEQIEWRLLQALCYEMMGNFSKAKRLFNHILKQNPLLLRALHGLAMVMHKNHEGEAVFDMLNQALEVASREKKVTEERNIKILIAQMHMVKGNLDEALKMYRELIDENPRDFRPYLCQGIIYSLQDKKEEADEQFEIFKSLVPEEFPQRGFLEDVVLAAKTESREQLEKEFKNQFSYKR